MNAGFVLLFLGFLNKGMNHSWAWSNQSDKVREISSMSQVTGHQQIHMEKALNTLNVFQTYFPPPQGCFLPSFNEERN